MEYNSPLDAIIEATYEAPIQDAEIVDPMEREPEPTMNHQGLYPNQQAAVTRANAAINALADMGMLEWWLENKLIPGFPREVKEALYINKR
jgi:hypothetical protein